jgi:hypothetical protein
VAIIRSKRFRRAESWLPSSDRKKADFELTSLRKVAQSFALAQKPLKMTVSKQPYKRITSQTNSIIPRSIMKKMLLLSALIGTVGPVLALPIFDPFADATANGGTSYTLGTALTNQFNRALFSPWYPRGVNFGSTQPTNVSGSLSYPGLPASTGNSVSFTGISAQNTCLDLNVAANQTPTVYASFLLKVTDVTAVSTTAVNNPLAAFGDDPTPNAGAQIGRLGTRLLTKKVGAGYVLGTSKSSTTTEFVYEPDANAHNVGDVVFVVMGYQRTAGVQTNVNLWINPLSSTFGASVAPSATLTAVGNSTTTALNNSARVFAILCQFPTAPTGVIDDVRIGNDWATVTGGPGIYTSPTNQTRNAGTNVTFTAAAFGGTPLSYQWQKDGGPLTDGGGIAGATTPTLTINNLLAANAGSYTVVVSNSYSVATSAAATLTVNDPWITAQPTNKAVNPGAATVLHVGAVGTPTLTYQWYKNTLALSDGGNISGSQSPDLTVTSFSSSDVGTYNVVVMNGLSSSMTSSNASIGLTDPSISAQPQSITNIYGTTANFQVTATGTAPLRYLWHKQGFGDLSDGGNISGSHTNVLTISGVSSADNGSYYVTVSNAVGGFVDSSLATLSVRDPAVTTQPVNATNSTGTTAMFHAIAVGTPSLTYLWYKNANIVFDDGVKYAGASTDTLWITNVAAGDQDTYHLTVLNGNGASEDSVGATLTVVAPPTPIAITVQPTPRKVLAGAQAALAVGYTGSSPQFQWQLAGTNVPGATAAGLILSNVQASVTGSYRVIVSNSINAQTSSPVSVSLVSSLKLYPTNIAVIRVGNGAQALATKGNSMFIDQWAPDGTYLTTMNLPDTGPDSILAIGPTLTTSPSSVTGNGLSRSANGRYLVVGGYNTNLTFTGELQSTAASVVPRAIGLVDDQGQYTLAVSSSSSSSGNFFRGACYDGTNNYWGFSRTSSTVYFGFDHPELLIQTDWSNLRSMSIFNNRIYGVCAVSGKTGVMRFTGMPTAAEAVEQVINTGSNFSSDCEVNPSANLIYVADNLPGTGGIQRWEFNGSTWNLAYTLNNSLPNGAYYVTADFSGPNPVVYAVTAEADNNTIVRYTDTGAGATGTIVANAGVNQNFRGLRLGPASASATPPLLSITRAPGAVILNWSGAFILQSSTNVVGTYTDVPSATAPYTNSTSGAQKFFRLRQ